VGKVDAWRASPKVWFTGGNVLICLKYLYNNTLEFHFCGILLEGHTISSFVSFRSASLHHLRLLTRFTGIIDKCHVLIHLLRTFGTKADHVLNDLDYSRGDQHCPISQTYNTTLPL
jgi:hypothetical protein